MGMGHVGSPSLSLFNQHLMVIGPEALMTWVVAPRAFLIKA